MLFFQVFWSQEGQKGRNFTGNFKPIITCVRDRDSKSDQKTPARQSSDQKLKKEYEPKVSGPLRLKKEYKPKLSRPLRLKKEYKSRQRKWASEKPKDFEDLRSYGTFICCSQNSQHHQFPASVVYPKKETRRECHGRRT